jgi:hypothetical protein
MVQRGPTYIMSTKEGMPRLLGGESSRFICVSSDLLDLTSTQGYTGTIHYRQILLTGSMHLFPINCSN